MQPELQDITRKRSPRLRRKKAAETNMRPGLTTRQQNGTLALPQHGSDGFLKKITVHGTSRRASVAAAAGQA